MWKLPAEGGSAVQVTKNEGRGPFESHDGKFVYYWKPPAPGGTGSPGSIWKVPVEGGEETQVFEGVRLGHWAALDQGIYFLNPDRMPRPAIEFFSFATRRVTLILDLPREVIPPAGFFPASFAISRDAQWILYLQVDRFESDIMLMENFR